MIVKPWCRRIFCTSLYRLLFKRGTKNAHKRNSIGFTANTSEFDVRERTSFHVASLPFKGKQFTFLMSMVP